MLDLGRRYESTRTAGGPRDFFQRENENNPHGDPRGPHGLFRSSRRRGPGISEVCGGSLAKWGAGKMGAIILLESLMTTSGSRFPYFLPFLVMIRWMHANVFFSEHSPERSRVRPITSFSVSQTTDIRRGVKKDQSWGNAIL